MSLADSFANPADDPDGVAYSERGPASIETVASFGFWLFLLSDVVMFSALFAAYAVLQEHVAGGPDGLKLFNRGYVLAETGCLFSSFTCALCLPSRATSGALSTFWVSSPSSWASPSSFSNSLISCP